MVGMTMQFIPKVIFNIYTYERIYTKISESNCWNRCSISIIDFGLSGLHSLSEGTGGTKPFCHPYTLNIDNNTNNSEYNWVKNEKKNDIWSISFIFASILIFRKCYSYYGDFPSDFFDHDKYININYLNYIPKQYRNAFILFSSSLLETGAVGAGVTVA